MIISLTIVAAGTSLPELITSIIAILMHEDEIALGNAIGSCIFNILLILGLSGMISDITFDYSFAIDMFIMLASSLALLCVAYKFKKINFITGIIMILLYGGYITYLLIK